VVGRMATWRDRVKSQAKAPQEQTVMRGNSTRTKDDTNPPTIKKTGRILPGERVYEDDERYEKAQILNAVKKWQRPGLRHAVEAPERPEKKVKDDVYTPPAKTIVDAAQKFKDRKAPPLLPIHPTVGPTQAAKQATGIRFGFTPEAQEMLHKTRVDMRVPIPGDNRGGGYYGATGNIEVIAPAGIQEEAAPNVLAHEFGHKWWDERLTDQEKASYVGNQNRWASQGSPHANDAITRFNEAQATSGLYDDDHAARGPETHARVMEQAEQIQARDMPAYMRPYFQGMLQNVPNPRPVRNPDPNNIRMYRTEDSGLMGAPPVQQWKNYW
jgi:hypothetical protein